MFKVTFCAVLLFGLSASITQGADLLVPDEYASIQLAIDSAEDGDAIIVSSGIYYEAINFNSKLISIDSVSGPESTVINAEKNQSSSAVTFLQEDHATELSSSLVGFTIKGGDAITGGGIRIQGANPLIENCIVTGNSSSTNGAGVFVESAVVTITDTNILNNNAGGAGGGIYIRYGFITLSDSVIQSNEASNGGGLYAKDSLSLIFNNLTFNQNEASSNGGALYIKESTLQIDNSTFSSNSSNRGGAFFSYSEGNAQFSDCVFSDNSALDLGGAASIRSNCEADFTTCIFDSNIADSDCDGFGSGGAIDIANSAVVLENITSCANMACDVLNDFSGDAYELIGQIFGCDEGTGACCGGTACWEMTSEDCLSGGGVFLGGGSVCDSEVCDETANIGSCCLGSFCVMTTESDCVDADGLFSGIDVQCEGTVCEDDCVADLNNNGSVDVDDLVLLISLWGACP